MGDLHGAYAALMQCLQRSGFNYREDKLIQLGDIVDGFNEVYECVEELLKIRNLVAIRGNHDDWFSSFIETDYHPQQWSWGGGATAFSYLKQIGKEHLLISKGNGCYKTGLNFKDIPETHQQFFRNQILYYIDDNNNCFVHGGFNPHLEFTKQPNNIYNTDRELWSAALAFQVHDKYGVSIDPQFQNSEPFKIKTSFREIFIGHTCTLKWNIDKPMKAANIINLDTGAGHNGRLTILDIETKQYWQSDPVSILYKRSWRLF